MIKAIQIDPPPLRRGQKPCICCGGPKGPKSWELGICLHCYDANEGSRIDPTTYMVKSQMGGGYRTVKLRRMHTMCPLAENK